jgi:hypothetical protein
MSSYPPLNWEIRYLREMDVFATPPPPSNKLTMTALLAVR